MGIGREVADAYISVHGDLSPFRRDLNGANKDAEKAAKQNADTFADEWGKRLGQQTKDRWASIVDTMYSGKKIDFNRMVENFDGSNFDDAQKKMQDFLLSMRRHGKLTAEEYAKAKKTLNEELDLMRERNQLDEQNAEQQRGLGMALEANRKFLADANKENERWARTLDGIRKNNAIRNLESDFRKLAETMDSADMGKFAKNFDNLHQARSRIYEVTSAMEQQGRMSREQSEKMQKDINDYIDKINAEVKAEKDAADEKSKITKDALDQTNRLREAQDRYNQSLSGMARNYHFGQLEDDFRHLAAAMDSNDWSHFARGADDIERMRRNIANTAGEMHRLGRMSDTEYGLILERVRDVNHAFDDGERKVGRFRDAIKNTRTVFSGLNKVTRGFREHLQGFAGLNVFGDMIGDGLDFIHNLDRIAVKASKLTVIFGSLASIGGSSLAGLAVIAQDLGGTIGGLAALLPAFATGAGLMAFVTISALGSLKKKFKTTFDQIKKDMGESMFTAMDPAMDRFNTVLLPTLKDGLKGLASSMGLLYGSIFDGIVDSVSPADMAMMFGRLDKAVEKSRAGVKSFVNAWAVLGKTGTKYFDRFAVWFNKLGASFDAFITKAEKDGQINKWIEAGIKGFKDLGRTIDGTLGIFNAIADAARRAGSGGLSSFADKMQGMAKAMQEQGFQDTLTTLFSGMNIAVGKIGAAIRDLGPAMQSVMPSIKGALINIGDAAATIIGYIGGILSNPLVQQGITDFTGGIKKALEILKPAMEPFANSIGNALTLLGKVVESVAKIATVFTVELAPVLDDMSIKMQTVLDPLADMATKAIEKLKPVVEAIDKYIIGPFAEAMKSAIIPAINDFIGKAAPFLEKVVTDLGPSFATLANTVLPNIIKFAGELLDPLGKVFDLFTPTLKDGIDKIGKGFDSLASAMRIAKGEARPEDWGILAGKFSTEGVKNSMDNMKKQMEELAHPDRVSWGDILSDMLWGDLPHGLTVAAAKLTDFVTTKLGPWFGQQLGQIGDVLGGLLGGKGDDKLNKLSEDVDHWIVESFRNLFDNILPDLQKANEGLSKKITDGLDSWWKGVKGMFQDWMRNTFGIGKDTSLGDNGAVIGGSVGGGKGMGVMGKITDEMLGESNDPKPLIQQWFDDVTTSISEGFGQIGANITQFGTDVSTNWNNFWGGLGTKVSEVWDGIVVWVTTKYTEISTNVTTWFTDFKTGWDGFWDGVGTKVSEVWNGMVTWVTTKYTEIKTNVDTFITDFTTGWTGFWDGIGTKVQLTWDFVKQWIANKVSEVKTNITNFINDTKTNWDNFWSGVGSKVQATWDFVKQWIDQKVADIKTGISNFGRDVKAGWDGFWNDVSTKVTTVWSDIKAAIERKAGEVIDFVRTMPQKITGQFSNMWAEMERVGGSIWQGLKQGIENGIQWVKDAARNLAANAVAAAKLALEVNSPSKAFRRLGLSGGEGMAQGFDWSGGMVEDASTSMAEKALGAFGHSTMYLAGKNASQGLADGLLANKSTIAAAYSNLGTFGAGNSLGKLSITADDRSSGAGAGRGMAAGAVQVSVTTAATDPNLVASKVSDTLDDAFARFSNI